MDYNVDLKLKKSIKVLFSMKESQRMKYTISFKTTILILSLFYRKEDLIFKTKNTFS